MCRYLLLSALVISFSSLLVPTGADGAVVPGGTYSETDQVISNITRFWHLPIAHCLMSSKQRYGQDRDDFAGFNATYASIFHRPLRPVNSGITYD